jgi:hypothetical protein
LDKFYQITTKSATEIYLNFFLPSKRALDSRALIGVANTRLVTGEAGKDWGNIWGKTPESSDLE